MDLSWTRDIVDGVLECDQGPALHFRRNSVAAGETLDNGHYYYTGSTLSPLSSQGRNTASIISQALKLLSILGFYVCVRKFERFLK